jgi:hypothetical protein
MLTEKQQLELRAYVASRLDFYERNHLRFNRDLYIKTNISQWMRAKNIQIPEYSDFYIIRDLLYKQNFNAKG